MRGILHVLVAVTIGLTAPTSALAAPSPRGHDPATDAQRVEQLLFGTPLSDFVATVERGDPWLDTSTDSCSAPIVHATGRSFDFRGPCRRHDFGYRNLPLLDRRYSCTNRPAGGVCAPAGKLGTYWNHAARERVDKQFLADMNATCSHRPWHQKYNCYLWARTFYAAVRVAGGP